MEYFIVQCNNCGKVYDEGEVEGTLKLQITTKQSKNLTNPNLNPQSGSCISNTSNDNLSSVPLHHLSLLSKICPQPDLSPESSPCPTCSHLGPQSPPITLSDPSQWTLSTNIPQILQILDLTANNPSLENLSNKIIDWSNKQEVAALNQIQGRLKHKILVSGIAKRRVISKD